MVMVPGRCWYSTRTRPCMVIATTVPMGCAPRSLTRSPGTSVPANAAEDCRTPKPEALSCGLFILFEFEVKVFAVGVADVFDACPEVAILDAFAVFVAVGDGVDDGLGADADGVAGVFAKGGVEFF